MPAGIGKEEYPAQEGGLPHYAGQADPERDAGVIGQSLSPFRQCVGQVLGTLLVSNALSASVLGWHR
ncbi:MAG: hypothetical protein OXN84_04930 [Albidovulum sp.]|nr:hypothetical protein [Albidovulum sp.]